MILNISTFTKENKGITLCYELTDENKETTTHTLFCKNLCNTTVSKTMIELLDGNNSIKKVMLSVPELQVKQDKIFKLIRQSPTIKIHPDGKVIRKKRLLERWTVQFCGEIATITSGEYKNQQAIFLACSDWDWKGQCYIVQILPSKEEKTLMNEELVFVERGMQIQWAKKEDVVPCFMTLANKIAAEIGRNRRPLTDIDEELDKRLTFIEENYGTIAINKIVLTEMDGTRTTLKRVIQKRAPIFAML